MNETAKHKYTYAGVQYSALFRYWKEDVASQVFSGRSFAQKCVSLLTTVIRGLPPYFRALSTARGATSRHKRDVDRSLTWSLGRCIDLSVTLKQGFGTHDSSQPSSVNLYLLGIMAALATRMSSLPASFSSLSANAITEENFARSNSHSSTALNPVSDLIPEVDAD
jgi:hypothetical protein